MAKRVNRGRGGKKVTKMLKEASADLEVASRSLDGEIEPYFCQIWFHLGGLG